MKRADNLERDLAIWLADTATPRVPDFTDDILRLTAGMRQRPRWSFPERWLPMSVITLARQTFKPLPWRTIGLLAVLALLIAAVAAYVGSRPRLPAPFGPAANGLVAYAGDGDIYTVDPITGASSKVTSGPEQDAEPRWSLDGTRLVFVRAASEGDLLVLVDPGKPDKLLTTEAFTELDSDSVAWSPDGRFISASALRDGSPGVFIVDTATGEATPLAVDFAATAVYWRPPDGRQLMVIEEAGPDLRFHLVSLADLSRKPVSLTDGSGPIRVSGWTPDGGRFLYQRGEYDAPPIETHVLDMTTGQEVTIDVGYGHISNDGTRMVALNDQEGMCVVELSGGPCVPIGLSAQAFGPSHATGVQWSPDDEWILTRPPGGDGTTAFLVDPDGAALEQPSWITNGAVSWQRVAP
jgi:dipeptidyl aminopeptidase/acylaminoacyl peptidase